MKKIYTIFFILLPLALFPQSVNLKIMETSDVHGSIFPFDFTTQKNSNGSLARVSSYLLSERARSDQEVILLDNGDILQGTPAVYYYNYENTKTPHLHSQVMNHLKYDAATIGNHDIETGHDVYDRFREELNFPWLAANAVDTINNKPYFEPYTIIERQGIKIAVYGLITPGIPNWLPYNLWRGIEFEDMIITAKKWVPEIIEKEKPDLLIGLFHSGIDYTYGNVNADTPRNENACKLVAQQVPGFDVIFAGHDHETWNFFEPNKPGDQVLILGPTSGARNIAVANIKMNFDSSTKKWEKEITGEIVDMRDYEPDQDFLKEFEKQFTVISEYVNRSIGELTEDIDSRESLFGDASFTDLIHSVQLDISDAQISFTAPLSIQSSLSKGQLFVRDMYNLYRYENFLYALEMTGKEIDNYLEYSYSLWFNEMKNENDNLLLFEVDEAGNLKWSERFNTPELKNRYYNFDTAEGINYIVDLSKPIGDRITITSLTNGEIFEPSSFYKVALNSYRGNGGGGHLISGAAISKEELDKRIIFSTDKDLRYYLMKWIEKNKIITPSANKNWKVIPEDWYNSAKTKDFNLLYD